RGDGGACHLHQLTHRAGHTIVLAGGRSAGISELAALFADLQEHTAGSLMFEASVAFSARPGPANHIGRIEPPAADRLGVEGITLFAVRPDGYIGLRSDRDHLKALARYRELIVSSAGAPGAGATRCSG